ncbi:hypothetical protein F7734_45525 [Scytonema sp. UIC 10036]|nr:hypothetical protein [Scytonema sp. UIC 10036]
MIQGEGNYQETNTYASEKKNLNQAAQEIQGLLEQLDNSYLTNTYFEKVKVAEEAIKRIESNPKLYQRVLSALKTGGAQAFEQFLNHPAASFVIGALEDWQKSKGT